MKIYVKAETDTNQKRDRYINIMRKLADYVYFYDPSDSGEFQNKEYIRILHEGLNLTPKAFSIYVKLCSPCEFHTPKTYSYDDVKSALDLYIQNYPSVINRGRIELGDAYAKPMKLMLLLEECLKDDGYDIIFSGRDYVRSHTEWVMIFKRR